MLVRTDKSCTAVIYHRARCQNKLQLMEAGDRGDHGVIVRPNAVEDTESGMITNIFI